MYTSPHLDFLELLDKLDESLMLWCIKCSEYSITYEKRITHLYFLTLADMKVKWTSSHTIQATQGENETLKSVVDSLALTPVFEFPTFAFVG